jgi:hypothetical protein
MTLRAADALRRTNSPPEHTPRHTATWLMQRGVPLWEAAGLIGMSVEVLQDNYGHHPRLYAWRG